MSTDEKIQAFLEVGPWAVVGASADRTKYGNKVLRCYLQKERTPVFPINPHADEVEGVPAYARLGELPERARAASIITPPPVTESVVAEAIEFGIEHLWMQPGAESAGLSVIAGGPCLLVVLGYRE